MLDKNMRTLGYFKLIGAFTQLSIPTHAQPQRHRLKFIKNHLKNS